MNLLKEIYQNLLLSFNKPKLPSLRGVYAVEHGDLVGNFLVFIKKNDETSYDFLCLPKMEIKTVPIESYNVGIENKIIVFVRQLPKSIYRVCYAQYIKNKKQPLKYKQLT